MKPRLKKDHDGLWLLMIGGSVTGAPIRASWGRTPQEAFRKFFSMYWRGKHEWFDNRGLLQLRRKTDGACVASVYMGVPDQALVPRAAEEVLIDDALGPNTQNFPLPWAKP